MKIKGEITFTYHDNKDSRLVYESLEVDNKSFIESSLEDAKIKYSITNNKLGSFLSTVDDLISAEIVVEKIIEKTNANEKNHDYCL